MIVCSVQVSSVAQSCLTLCDPMNHSTPGLHVHHHLLEFTQNHSTSGLHVHHKLLEFTQTHVHRVGDAIQPSYPLWSPLLLPQSFPASASFPVNQLFALDGQSIGSFSISPSNEYSGLIYFRMDWFDLLAVQGTLKSLLQHHSSKASIPCCTTKEIPTQ